MKKIKIKESQVQNAIIQYLTLKKLFFWRNNSGCIFSNKRMIRLGITGSPDIYILKKGVLIGLEIKGSEGKQTALQKKFQQRFEKEGGLYYLVREINDLDL